MALWDKLKTELDRAGRAAQTAFDEGKARLEILRVRQLADKAAQALGYAVFRARSAGGDIDEESYTRLSGTLAAHEAEIARLEAQLAAEKGEAGQAADASGASATSEPPSGGPGAGPTPGGSTRDGGASGQGGAHGGGAGGTPPFSGPSSHAQGVDPAQGDTGRSGSPQPPGF